MKTKAAILTQLRSPLEIDEVEIPPLKTGQVLVRIHASRICGSQIGEIDGVKGEDPWLPHLLGHEGAGVVEETGPGVTHVKTGDEVVLHWRPSKGIQCTPPIYKCGNKKINAGCITTFSHYSVISENRLTVVDADFDHELRCLMADTLTTGFGIINRDAGVKLGESVVVVGAGGIGSGAVLGAYLAGANPIIAVDIHAHKLDHAKRLGATHTIDSSIKDFETSVREILTGGGGDVVIDGTGNPSIIESCYRLTDSKGRTILFGVPHHTNAINIHSLPLHFGRSILGSEGGQSIPHEDIHKYYNLIIQRKVDLSGMVTHRGNLNDVNRLISLMRDGKVIHAIMHYSD